MISGAVNAVDVAEGVPLVGMRLMLDNKVEIHVKDGGSVTVAAV